MNEKSELSAVFQRKTVSMSEDHRVPGTGDLKNSYKRLRLILGDQLNAAHSWYQQPDEETLYLMAELPQEVGYARHHVQKVEAFFLAMTNFAQALQKAGCHVLHLTLDDTHDYADLDECLADQLSRYGIREFEYQRPDEYRLYKQLERFSARSQIPVRCVDTEHFLVPADELPQYFISGKSHRMESFYRKLRRRFNILMNGTEPSGGRWNFDTENRSKLKPSDLQDLPAPLVFANDARAVRARLSKHSVQTFGVSQDDCLWPVNRRQALSLLAFFCEHCLPNFGRFQDAMSDQSEFSWSLYHSRLSFALNSKMLSPLLVVSKALEAYDASDGRISLAQIEGFVRQVIGWREFVRGIYWANMPEYATLNHLNAERDLPQQYWSGQTRMNCMAQSIGQTLDYAYAHHIQRLMVTGNFALLAGIDPDQVDPWYLGVYVDAIEWVEMPNTRGMSQFADGGLVGSKAYAASGNYIHKMSDYCRSCFYSVKEKTGPKACPFNALYWDFMVRNREILGSNPRQNLVYKHWDRQSKDEQDAIRDKAQQLLVNLDGL